MRTGLVSALCACVGDRKRGRARRFLQGLSSDELQYIAEFLGSCILDHRNQTECTRAQLAEGIAQFERFRKKDRSACAPGCRNSDGDHKMILLLEYLWHYGPTQLSINVRAGQI